MTTKKTKNLQPSTSYLVLLLRVQGNTHSATRFSLPKMSNQTPSRAARSSWPCLNRAEGADSLRGSFQPQLLWEPVKQIPGYYLGNDDAREFGAPLMKPLVLATRTAGWKAWGNASPWWARSRINLLLPFPKQVLRPACCFLYSCPTSRARATACALLTDGRLRLHCPRADTACSECWGEGNASSGSG